MSGRPRPPFRGSGLDRSTVSAVAERWEHGDLIVRREVLGLAPRTPPVQPSEEWVGRPWLAVPVFVVEDTDDALVTFIAPGDPYWDEQTLADTQTRYPRADLTPYARRC